MKDPNRTCNHLAIDTLFSTTKADMHEKALGRAAEGLAVFTDSYTGKKLSIGDPYLYEHIRSSEVVFNKYKSILTDEQIALITNCPDNIAVTLRSINKAKGELKMEDWLSNQDHIINHQINLELTLENLKKTDEALEFMARYLQK